MKNIIKKINILPLVVVALLVITSCEDNIDGVTNPGEIGSEVNARFTKTKEGKTITFINISENATSYEWDFGDGTTSTLINPIKKYTNGNYTVSLKAYNKDGDSSTAETSFVIDGCTDETAENLNPANDTPLNWTFLNAEGNAAFDAFGSIGGGIVDNPVLDDINSSCNVFLYSKLNGCQTWSGAGYRLGTALDFSTMTNKVFKIKVLAETQITKVSFVLEVVPQSPIKLTREADITEIGKWQELTFDFSDVSSGTYDNMLVYFERNAPCDGDVYYFDDIIQTQ